MPSNSRKRRSDGEGSVYQRHTKECPRPTDARGRSTCKCKWLGVVTRYHQQTGEDGRTRMAAARKTVTASTRAGAAAKLLDLQEKLRADELPEGKPITVQQWLTYWLDKVVPRGNRKGPAKQSTIDTYATNVRQYLVPLLGHHRLDRLTAEHINEAWDQLLEDGNPTIPAERRVPLSPNSVHLAHTILRRALKVAVQRKRLRVNPAGTDSMDAPPRVEKEIEPIPAAEVEKILAEAEHDPAYGARWSVALALGLRPSEALGLRWEDVDLDEGLLHVRQQLTRQKGKGLVASSPKSEAGKRTLVLPATLLAQLKAHRKAQNEARLAAGDHWTPSGYVFVQANGQPLDSKADWLRWTALLDRAGVPRRRLYDARHSAATMLLAQKVEPRVVMALLGHSQISVTMRYQHAVDELKADAARRIETGVWGSAQ